MSITSRLERKVDLRVMRRIYGPVANLINTHVTGVGNV